MRFKKVKILLLALMVFGGFSTAHAQFSAQFDLINAVGNNNIDKINEIFRQRNIGPDVRRRADGLPVLILAIDKRHYESAKLLLERGANVNIRTREDRSTALMRAAALGNRRLVKLILDHNPDVNLRDTKNESALLKAVRAKKTSIAEMLLKAGASVEGGDITGQTAMDYARKNGSTRMKRLLEAAGAH